MKAMNFSKEYNDKQAEQIFEDTILEMSNLFQNHPFYFINEENLRSMIFAKIVNKFPKTIYYEKSPNGEQFTSSPIHVNPCIKDKNGGQYYPDLLIHYCREYKNSPISTTHKMSHRKNHPETKYRRKVWFYATNKQAETCIDKRVIVEIKFNKHFNKLSGRKIKKIHKDINKIKQWDFSKAYMIHFDRSNKMNSELKEEIIKAMMTDDEGKQIEYFYSGYSQQGNGQFYHLTNKDMN